MATTVAGTKNARAGSDTSLHGRLASGDRHAFMRYTKKVANNAWRPMAAQKKPLGPPTIISPAATNGPTTAPRPYNVTSCEAAALTCSGSIQSLVYAAAIE